MDRERLERVTRGVRVFAEALGVFATAADALAAASVRLAVVLEELPKEAADAR